MGDKIVIKKTWNDARIRLHITSNELTIECGIDDFINRVAHIAGNEYDRKIKLSFRDKTVSKLVSNSVSMALVKAISELKQESVKIV